jgi:hypothetical protein
MDTQQPDNSCCVSFCGGGLGTICARDNEHARADGGKRSD